MSLYPAAVKKLIPPGDNDPRIKARVAILHVAVSEADSLHDYFNGPSDGIESHFYIRRNGVVEQYRDTAFEADANYRANPFAISIETEGMGEGYWTVAQMDAIKALLLWLHGEHGIPLRQPGRWDGTGVSYHSRYPEWSPGPKSCPGPDRIKQFIYKLVPWMRDVRQEDDEVTEQDKEDIADLVVKKLLDGVQINTRNGDWTPRQLLRGIYNNVKD